MVYIADMMLYLLKFIIILYLSQKKIIILNLILNEEF